MSSQDSEAIRQSIERVSRWMNTHGAPLLVDNLAVGASPEQLAQAEGEFGVALPSELRALWSLHDGQREEGNGFVEAFDLLSTRTALDQRESVLAAIAFARESPEWWAKSGGTTEELQSDHWLPFAGRDSDSLVVHGVTGRVFRCNHDDAPELVAATLVEWFRRYADRVEADDYAVADGFGDYYLELRDREAERREQERERRALEHERVRRETPLLEQLRNAIESKREDRCGEVLKDSLERDDKKAFDAAVTLLFSSGVGEKFVAAALRTSLKAVTLSPDQWIDVAMGGALLENNAVRDIAISRAEGFSAARFRRLEAAIASASVGERTALEHLLQKLRAKWPSASRSETDGGNWFSKLWRKSPREK